MSIGANGLIPSHVGALVAVQNIGQLTVSQPLAGVVGQLSSIDAIVIAVQVVAVDKLAGTDTTAKAVLAILSVDLTC